MVAATLWCLGSPLAAESRLPGIESAQLGPALKGRLLLEELNCIACHAAPAGADLKSKQAPRLAEVAQRIHPTYLEKYIGATHTTKPGSTMPDLLAKLPEAERATAAKELTHFLLSLKASTFAPQAPDAVAATQGEKLFHARGCAACHSGDAYCYY
jgi:cytochrome c2